MIFNSLLILLRFFPKQYLSYSHFSHFYFCKFHGKNMLIFDRLNGGGVEGEAEWFEEVGRDDYRDWG